MNKGYTQSQWSDVFNRSGLNPVGLGEAEKNYFSKYANSGFSEINKLNQVTQRSEVKITHETGAFNKIKNSQNEVLRQLKQQYEILRNLPIDDKLNVKPKHEKHTSSVYSSSIDQRSDITSSKKSGHKKGSRQAQIWNLEKKQLEIVISNSLKKIQQLLTNEMELKKIIHEQRIQIQGKGGINSEYELTIRNHKKIEKQLGQTIEHLKIQIEKKNFSLKELGEKNAFLEGEKSRKDNQYKSFFDEQRHLDDLLRKQKDKTLNTQIQYRRIQMEFEMLQKDKNAQISRLMKQIQMQNQIPQRDSQIIQRLQDEIKSKDQRYEKLSSQMQILRSKYSRPQSPPPEDKNKNALEQLVKQMKAKQLSAKDNNEAVVRALIDKLGARKDEGLKNQISTIRLQLENIKKGSGSDYQGNSNQQSDLKYRIRDLQKTIQQDRREKQDLYEQIQNIKIQRNNLYNQCQLHQIKINGYKQTQQGLLHRIQELGNFKFELQQSKMQNQQMKNKLEHIMGQNYHQGGLSYGQNNEYGGSGTQQVRQLHRQIDTLTFSLNKANEQKSMNERMMQQTQSKQYSQLNDDLNRYKNLLRSKQQECTRLNQSLRRELQQKHQYSEQTNRRLQDIETSYKNQLGQSKGNYQSLIKAEVAKHYTELQTLNRKFIEITKTNELYTQKSQYYANLQKQVIQLRKMSRASKRITETLDHLWQIKEAQYGNVNEILASVRNIY